MPHDKCWRPQSGSELVWPRLILRSIWILVPFTLKIPHSRKITTYNLYGKLTAYIRCWRGFYVGHLSAGTSESKANRREFTFPTTQHAQSLRYGGEPFPLAASRWLARPTSVLPCNVEQRFLHKNASTVAKYYIKTTNFHWCVSPSPRPFLLYVSKESVLKWSDRADSKWNRQLTTMRPGRGESAHNFQNWANWWQNKWVVRVCDNLCWSNIPLWWSFAALIRFSEQTVSSTGLVTKKGEWAYALTYFDSDWLNDSHMVSKQRYDVFDWSNSPLAITCKAYSMRWIYVVIINILT